MYLVVGLGNPGPRYAGTRHNCGVLVTGRLAEKFAASWRPQFEGRCALVSNLVLLEPHTFMNRSGESVVRAAQHFGLGADHILVVHDEIDLPFGSLKLKFGGGEAGHRGLQSVSAALGVQAYGRLRVGVGRPGPEFVGTTAEFVLDRFAPDEEATLPALVGGAASAVEAVGERGFDATMNDVNRRS